MLHTLGKLELEDSSFQRVKPLFFLAYLALEGAQDRRFVAELFWSDSNDALNSLSAVLSLFRKHAPGVIEASPNQVWTGIKCDATLFLQAVETGQREEALKFYSGVFLQGVSLPDWNPALEEWVYGTREALANQARACLLALAEAKTSQGHKAEGAQLAEHAYRLPSAPPASVETLSCIYRLLSISQSPQTRSVMQEIEELGIDIKTIKPAQELPGNTAGKSETADEPSHAKNHNLPRVLTSFIGRDAEKIELVKQLSKPDCHLLTLVGMGGIGKSRLALQLARDWLEASKSEGVYFVRLEALTSSGLIPSAIADALGITLEGTEEPFQQIIKHIANKRLLLVLDNFEQFLKSATMLKKLLEACPNLKLLVTSRERLNLSFEYVLSLEGLAYPKTSEIPLQEALSFEALQLFVQRAKHAKLDYFPTQEDVPHLVRITQLNQGSPLGLELAAAWIKALDPKEIAEEISKSISLTATARDSLDRHQSLKSVFEYSWQMLTHKEQEVMRKLSVFQGGFTREAAGHLEVSIHLLARLIDKSLLQRSSEGRFDIHPLLHEFITQKLEENSKENSELLREHGLYYLQFLQDISETQRRSVYDIETEQPNIFAAWNWAIIENVELLYEASGALRLFFNYRSRYREGADFFIQTAKNLDEQIPHHQKALGRVLVSQSLLAYRLEDYKEARRAAEKGLGLLKNLQNSHTAIVDGLHTLCTIAWRTGDLTQAKLCAQEMLVQSKANNNLVNLATSYSNLALIEEDLGNYDRSEEYNRLSISIYRQEGREASLGVQLGNLGSSLLEAGRFEEAQTLLEEGLEISIRLGVPHNVPYLLSNLSLIAFELKKFHEAETKAMEALEVVRKNKIISLESTILGDLGRIYTALGKYALSKDYIFQCLSYAKRIKDEILIGYGLFVYTELLARRGEKVQSLELLTWLSSQPNLGKPEIKKVKSLLDELINIPILSVLQISQNYKLQCLEDVAEQVLSGTFEIT
jgi:tetratricopeptide (TPR) repeat protein